MNKNEIREEIEEEEKKKKNHFPRKCYIGSSSSSLDRLIEERKPESTPKELRPSSGEVATIDLENNMLKRPILEVMSVRLAWLDTVIVELKGEDLNVDLLPFINDRVDVCEDFCTLRTLFPIWENVLYISFYLDFFYFFFFIFFF